MEAVSPLNVRVVSQPLVAENSVGQPVLVGDARGVRRQRLAHLAVPLMVGAPVAGLFGRVASTANVRTMRTARV